MSLPAPSIDELVAKHYDSIVIQRVSYDPCNDSQHDVASLTLDIPVALWDAYAPEVPHKDQKEAAAIRLFNELGLAQRLKERLPACSPPVLPCLYGATVVDVLEYLGGNIFARIDGEVSRATGKMIRICYDEPGTPYDDD